MFHRRLWLLGGVVVLVWFGLGAQAVRLTVVQGAGRRAKAEAALVRRRLIPTSRGRILDRRMRVLAVDRASSDVCVRYSVLTGRWAYERGRRSAYRANRSRWGELSYEQRALLVAEHQRGFDEQVEGLWSDLCEVGGITRAELERRKTTVVRRVKGIASDVWEKRLEREVGEDEQPVTFEAVARPIGEQRAAHPLLRGVGPVQIAAVQRLIADAERGVWDQVQVRASRERHYPMESMNVFVDRRTFPSPLRSERPVEVTIGGVGLHLVGVTREVWKEDVERRPFRRQGGGVDLGGYLPGDQTGRWGVEMSQEDYLRGLRGQVVSRLDRVEQERHEPAAGRDVVMTVDVLLQARVQALLDPRLGLAKVQPWQRKDVSLDPARPVLGDALGGAVVVLDVAQGQVLAAVSSPSFSLDQMRQDSESVWGDAINRPYVDRALGQPYQPGSTLKPVVLAAGVAEGVLSPGEEIECRGHLDPGAAHRYRCWIYKLYGSTHGALGGSEAIARSCNIYFYTLGRRMGAERLVRWYDRFGLGQVTGAGVPGEGRGDLPDLARAGEPNARGFSGSDAIFMAIGQGPVRWTVLQAASAYATLARGGVFMQPTFILRGGGGVDRGVDRGAVDLRVDPAGLEVVMEGLRDAVGQRHGSANHLPLLNGEAIFNIEGVVLHGKSGTAQGVSRWVDEDGDRRFTRGVDRIVRRGDHAWVICMAKRAGSPHPDYVVAVVVEYGGSGGAVAGPIANQVLHAMRAEGYL